MSRHQYQWATRRGLSSVKLNQLLAPPRPSQSAAVPRFRRHARTTVLAKNQISTPFLHFEKCHRMKDHWGTTNQNARRRFQMSQSMSPKKRWMLRSPALLDRRPHPTITAGPSSRNGRANKRLLCPVSTTSSITTRSRSSAKPLLWSIASPRFWMSFVWHQTSTSTSIPKTSAWKPTFRMKDARGSLSSSRTSVRRWTRTPQALLTARAPPFRGMGCVIVYLAPGRLTSPCLTATPSTPWPANIRNGLSCIPSSVGWLWRTSNIWKISSSAVDGRLRRLSCTNLHPFPLLTSSRVNTHVFGFSCTPSNSTELTTSRAPWMISSVTAFVNRKWWRIFFRPASSNPATSTLPAPAVKPSLHAARVGRPLSASSSMWDQLLETREEAMSLFS
ncbi:hypothetical protein DFH06DRAFT_1195904 [Mycena polygramma]|nr:hypothetical protein DFH06DRAFT_1195904 [Mycena polygramma]